MKIVSYVIIILFFILQTSCTKNKKEEQMPCVPETPTTPIINDINNTLGFGVLNKLVGIWNGPVVSTTALGNYPEWIVDFRPLSENQISAKNELDTLNDIFLSFFIAKYNNAYKVAFRNGGSFGGTHRVSYFLADSVSETTTQSYYRFVEIIKGKNRAYTEVIFKADSMYLKSYTNNYNTQITATPHMVWSAKLQDNTSAQNAVNLFGYPKKTITKDFSTTFVGQTEAIYFALTGLPIGDPYPETMQPYLGQTTVNVTYASTLTPTPTNKVFIIITTQPLFSGFVYNAVNLKFRSRYVVLAANDTQFIFNYMHPGTYYYYALYDADGNNSINSGDWMSLANTTFNLGAIGIANTSTQINFVIP